MICKGCKQEKRLVGAHIIPASFFRDLKAGEDHLKLISAESNGRAKRSRVGIYDKNILCRDCEDKFQRADSYAAEILIPRSGQTPITDGVHVAGYRLTGIDCELLKRFFVSVLWRASISRDEFFGRVNLGPLEDLARSVAWNEVPEDEDQFSYVLARFEGVGTLSKVILDPHPERFDKVRYYRFYLAGYVLYIKASSCPTPQAFTRLIARDNEQIVISRGEIERSKEFSVMLNGVLGRGDA